jgi:hypothetical protein
MRVMGWSLSDSLSLGTPTSLGLNDISGFLMNRRCQDRLSGSSKLQRSAKF